MNLKKYIKKPKLVLLVLEKYGLVRLDDVMYLGLKYEQMTGKKLNLNNPKSFNEKLQWLKLHDRKKNYTTMVDKAAVKDYVANIIGKEYIIPTIGVYDSFDEIDFSKLPNQFVIKCTHDSESVIICRDKNKFDIETSRKSINKALKRNYYSNGREWPYKNVKGKIIIEKYMEDKKYKSMRDYKFFCFDGKPYCLYLSEGLEEHSTARMSFFDMNFNLIDLERSDYAPIEYIPTKPINFDLMIDFASKLSRDIPQVRVDFYEINGKLYFGELTFYTCSGFIPFKDEKWNRKLGDMINIDKVKGD